MLVPPDFVWAMENRQLVNWETSPWIKPIDSLCKQIGIENLGLCVCKECLGSSRSFCLTTISPPPPGSTLESGNGRWPESLTFKSLSMESRVQYRLRQELSVRPWLWRITQCWQCNFLQERIQIINYKCWFRKSSTSSRGSSSPSNVQYMYTSSQVLEL